MICMSIAVLRFLKLGLTANEIGGQQKKWISPAYIHEKVDLLTKGYNVISHQVDTNFFTNRMIVVTRYKRIYFSAG